MKQEKYSIRQVILFVLLFDLAAWALIISGLIGLYYLVKAA